MVLLIKMMQSMNRYTATTTAKTAEIMARYRPIAPKPQVPVSPTGGGEADQNPSMSPKIRQSPYLRNVWPHLQARPTRTRKRGRTSLAPPPFVKRSRNCLQGLSPPFQLTTSPVKNLSLQGFAHCPNGLIPQVCPLSSLAALNASSGLESPTATPATLVTLPLLPCLSTLPMESHESTNIVDLNRVARIPEEKDFLTQLQGPASTAAVISPRPIRPVGSSISIWSIKEDARSTHELQIQQKAEEVEEELESETLPAVVSDSNNKVRLVNSAYKEMLGQPECPWLDSMVPSEGGGACKRICGEVTLHFSDPDPNPNAAGDMVVSSDGFSCRVSIEWGSNGKKAAVNAFCQVTRLFCESKDYLFAWKLHTREASDAASTV